MNVGQGVRFWKAYVPPPFRALSGAGTAVRSTVATTEPAYPTGRELLSCQLLSPNCAFYLREHKLQKHMSWKQGQHCGNSLLLLPHFLPCQKSDPPHWPQQRMDGCVGRLVLAPAPPSIGPYVVREQSPFSSEYPAVQRQCTAKPKVQSFRQP